MKKLKILLLLSFLIILVISSCIHGNKTEIAQPTKIPIFTETKIKPITSTPTRTQAIILNPITNTPEPSKTKTYLPITATASPTFTENLNAKLIILVEFNVNYLEEILTGRGYNLLAEGKAIDIFRWKGTGCTLIAATRDEIVEMDLQGKILHSIFSFNQFHTPIDGVILSPPSYSRRAIDALSPDETWIAYKIGSGNVEERGDDLEPIRYEYENLETMSLDGTQGPYRLSQNGGAWRAAWSPDSNQIAYSDYDDQGVHQLFVISRNGANRKQITSFIDPKVEIMKILWSPKGDKIAILVDQDGDESDDETILLNFDENNPPKELKNIFAEWWRDDDVFIAWKIIEDEPRHAELITLETSTNIESTVRPEGCYRINPFGNPSMVGCMTYDDKFVVYDSRSGEATVYSKFDSRRFAVQYWIAAPDANPGSKVCDHLP
jgi:WD40-like Beta Propeller Repeat